MYSLELGGNTNFLGTSKATVASADKQHPLDFTLIRLLSI